MSLAYALRYTQLGYSVFPCIGKMPLTKSGFKDASTDQEQVTEWWKEHDHPNIGIAIGPQLIVLDVDGNEGRASIVGHDLSVPSTITARTSRGHHYYYGLPEELWGRCSNRAAVYPGVDIRAEGGYVIAPPSVHPDGGRYEWVVVPKPSNLCDAPDWLTLASQGASPEDEGTEEQEGRFEFIPDSKADEIFEGVDEGSRNHKMTKYAGLLKRRGNSIQEAINLCLIAADRCTPPLGKKETVKCVKSVYTRYANNNGQRRPQKKGKSWDLSSLVETEFPKTNWIAKNLIPPGLTLLVGGPKAGKSFLAGEVGLSFARNQPMLAAFPTGGGKVLYLDLEQNARRASERWRMVLGSDPLPRGRMTLNFEWPTVSDGGLDEIRTELNADKELRLVVIDIMEKFVGTAKDSGGPGRHNVYSADYQFILHLVDLAKEYVNRGLGIILLHHTNKLQLDRSNPLNAISGSNGLSGAADTILVLFREAGKQKADLYVTGKEVEDRWIELRWSSQGWVAANALDHMDEVWEEPDDFEDPKDAVDPTVGKEEPGL